MANENQKAFGTRFLDMHHGPDLFVLPNAWDAGTAMIFADAGFKAIGTTSAGIAFAHGIPDGERMPRETMVAAVRAIARRVPVPVSVDLETGYGKTPEQVAETIRMVVDAGAVGCNIEDGALGADSPLIAMEAFLARLEAARAAADTSGVTVTINARTDPFLRRRKAPEAENFEEAVTRAAAYRAAGADCIFIPWVAEAALVGRLVAAIDAPVNVLGAMAGFPAPDLDELRRLGVRRVSIGGSLCVATFSMVQDVAREILETGKIGYTSRLSNGDMNKLLG